MKTVIENSMLVRLPDAFDRGAQHSGAVARWVQAFGREDPAVHSAYQAWLLRIQQALERFASAWETSAVGRALRAVHSSALRFTQGSAIAGPMLRIPLRRWLLIVFALYLPVEYALRTLPGLARVASVWEEAFIAAGLALVFGRAALSRSKNLARANATEQSR